MTSDEYRAALESLTKEQLQAFYERIGGQENTIDGRVQALAYTKEPEQLERIIVFRLREQGVDGIQTESEKLMTAALSSAAAAEVSAESAASSAKHSRRSVILAGIAIVVSLGVALLQTRCVDVGG